MAGRRVVRSKKYLPATLVTGDRSPCAFCKQDLDDEATYGKLYAIGNLQCHYFCVLLSCCLVQHGKDTEGLFGFLYPDILAEIERSKKHKCSYCGLGGASLGCCVSACRKQFHLPCARRKNALSLFFGNYKSYCQQHAPKQKLPDHLMAIAKVRMKRAKTVQVADDHTVVSKVNNDGRDCNGTVDVVECVCLICYESVSGFPSIDTFWPPCCARDSWFHRPCVQRMALSSGMHYLKCPLCNDKDNFYTALLEQGYYVPDRDAAWELEENAFAEIYERPVACSAATCLCPDGREFDADNGSWCITLCVLCGWFGWHAACCNSTSTSSGSVTPRVLCDVCTPHAPQDIDKLIEDFEKAMVAEQAASRANRQRLLMPSRMSLRRTKPTLHRDRPSTSSSTSVTQSNTVLSRLELNINTPRLRSCVTSDNNSVQKSTDSTLNIGDSTPNITDSTLKNKDSTLISTDSILNTKDSTQKITDSTLKIIDSTQNITDSTLKNKDSTLISTDSTLNTTDSTQKITDSSLKITDSTQNITDSTLKNKDSTLISTDSTLNTTDSTQITDSSLKITDSTQNITDSTLKIIDSTQVLKNIENTMMSPVKLLKDCLNKKIGVLGFEKIDSSVVFEKAKSRLRKPRPLSVKRRIVSNILDDLLDEIIKQNHHIVCQKATPKKIQDKSPSKTENQETRERTEDFTDKTPTKTDENQEIGINIDASKVVTPMKTEKMQMADDNLNVNEEFELKPNNVEVIEEKRDLNVTNNVNLSYELVKPTDLDVSLTKTTPKKLKTVDFEKDSSLEISESEEKVNIDVIKMENTATELKVKIPLSNIKSNSKINERISGKAKAKSEDLDMECFKNYYLTEVDRQFKCNFNHDHKNGDPEEGRPTKLRTAIDFAIDATLKEKSKPNLKRKSLNKDDIATQKRKKGINKGKVVLKYKKDNNIKVVCSKERGKETLDLTVNSNLNGKRKKFRKNKRSKRDDIQVKIRFKKEQVKLRIIKSEEAKPKKKGKKVIKQVKNSPKSPNLKQYVLNFTDCASSPTEQIAKPEQDVTPKKIKKVVKQEKNTDNMVQTSIQSFFKMRSLDA